MAVKQMIATYMNLPNFLLPKKVRHIFNIAARIKETSKDSIENMQLKEELQLACGLLCPKGSTWVLYYNVEFDDKKVDTLMIYKELYADEPDLTKPQTE